MRLVAETPARSAASMRPQGKCGLSRDVVDACGPDNIDGKDPASPAVGRDLCKEVIIDS
jgi:hypothetical protein